MPKFNYILLLYNAFNNGHWSCRNVYIQDINYPKKSLHKVHIIGHLTPPERIMVSFLNAHWHKRFCNSNRGMKHHSFNKYSIGVLMKSGEKHCLTHQTEISNRCSVGLRSGDLLRH